ncbi:IS110 family transposase [bacterium]|nr:IS110 family transposase [bacterium]
MIQSVLGIDVSKDTLDVVLLKEETNTYASFSNNPVGFGKLARWLISQGAGQVHACLEATGQYGDGVAEYLYQAGHAVSVVNPARIKRYGDSKLHRNKTDKADAALIAEFCRKEIPALWAPLPAYLKQLRQMVRRLEDLQANYQQERNRLSSGVSDTWVVEDIQDHLKELSKRIKALKQAIFQVIIDTAELKEQFDLLLTIPGIGKLTAARLLAEMGDIACFEDAPQLAAYAGLNPKGFRSGSSVHKKTHISKEGRALLRRILYMPAIVACRCNPIVHVFCDRLTQHGLPKMAVVAAAMRQLLRLVFGVLTHKQPFDPHYLLSPTFTS